jgi:hypothetical protein
MTTINYGADYLDPSKLLKRLEELKEMDHEDEEFDPEEFDTLNDLEDALREAENNGSQLIHEHDFEDYCKELLRDTETCLDSMPWYIVIDWEATGDNMRIDYSSVEIFGDTYLYR